MRDEIATVVFPVLRHGIRLRQRLQSRHGDLLDWQREQKEILGLLQATPRGTAALADYLGDYHHGDARRSQDAAARYESFLGIRYALACWIDEIMIQRNLPWNDIWNENKIESQLYGGNLRAEKFWDQARRAQVRPSRDPLEVFYLCVVLGFRGELVDQPEKVQAWRDQVEVQLTDDHAWTPPPDQKIKPHVPALTGPRRKQRMLLVATITALVAIPLLILGFILLFNKN